MLVISRKCKTEVQIGPDIIIKVLEIHKGQIKLGIVAPRGSSIWRRELLPIADRGELRREEISLT